MFPDCKNCHEIAKLLYDKKYTGNKWSDAANVYFKLQGGGVTFSHSDEKNSSSTDVNPVWCTATHKYQNEFISAKGIGGNRLCAKENAIIALFK